MLVTGPAELQAGTAAAYDIVTTAITGEPLRSQIELSLHSPDGTPLVHRERSEESGILHVAIPADMVLGRRPSCEWRPPVPASGNQCRRRWRSNRPAISPNWPWIAVVSAWRDIYYRSLTLSRLGLGTDRRTPIHFDIHAPDGSVLPKSALEGLSERGAGNGAFATGRVVARRTVYSVGPRQRRQFFLSRSKPSSSNLACQRRNRETKEEKKPVAKA